MTSQVGIQPCGTWGIAHDTHRLNVAGRWGAPLRWKDDDHVVTMREELEYALDFANAEAGTDEARPQIAADIEVVERVLAMTPDADGYVEVDLETVLACQRLAEDASEYAQVNAYDTDESSEPIDVHAATLGLRVVCWRKP